MSRVAGCGRLMHGHLLAGFGAIREGAPPGQMALWWKCVDMSWTAVALHTMIDVGKICL